MTPASPQLPASLPPEVASVILGDLAQRLGVGQRDVTIVSAEQVQAPPGTLGCGENAGSDRETITAIEVVARVNGEAYVYRTDRRILMPCSANFPGSPGPIYLSGVAVSPAGRPQDAAITDLAQRLSIPETEIKVVSVESVEWPDASMGCPQPGMMYAQVISPGYLVILEAGGRSYRYHGGRNAMFLCTNRSGSIKSAGWT
jgi:hypothetical protein